MKLTFERTLYEDILRDMEQVLALAGRSKINMEEMSETPKTTALPSNGSGQGPGPETVASVAQEEPVQEDFFEPPKKTSKKSKPVQEPPKELTATEKVALRQQTVDDLQKAFAGGKQQPVLALLAKYGNGAKSFRELPVEAFIPIREAIDAGALA